MACPIPTDPSQCKLRQCSPKERQVNELKCNTPKCNDQDLCIPVYYTPSDLKPSVSFNRFEKKTFSLADFVF